MNPLDRCGYFEVRGTHLYTVLHEVPDPLARVLLVGAFGSERNTAYTPWVRWSRYLALRGIECLRFDYRGMGESTGDFAGLSFEDWSEDVELMAEWLNNRSPAVPLVLHGLELGALLAGKAFAADWETRCSLGQRRLVLMKCCAPHSSAASPPTICSDTGPSAGQ